MDNTSVRVQFFFWGGKTWRGCPFYYIALFYEYTVGQRAKSKLKIVTDWSWTKFGVDPDLCAKLWANNELMLQRWITLAPKIIWIYLFPSQPQGWTKQSAESCLENGNWPFEPGKFSFLQWKLLERFKQMKILMRKVTFTDILDRMWVSV